MNFMLHSTVIGTGEPIVLLHGFLSSGHYFKHIRQTLASNHTVITLDLLGFGKSPKPKLGYTYDDHFAAINYTLQKLGVSKPFILLGHSMGAHIALKYAVQYPTSVKKLLLFNPPIFADYNEMVSAHKATSAKYRLLLFSRTRHLLWFCIKLIPRNVSRRRAPINLTESIRMGLRAREGSYHNIIGGATVLSDLQKVSAPTLLVTGTNDRPEYVKNLRHWQAPKNVDSRIIDVDHHPLVRKHKEAHAIISDFI